MQDPDFNDLLGRLLEESERRLGRANICIAGKTGVGKSTLINAVFQGDLAKTGQGRPVTQETTQYTKEGIPLTVWDTRGLELEKFSETTRHVTQKIVDLRSGSDASAHIHVAWVCIAEDSRRVEDGEAHLSEQIDALGVPVIAVITKARSDQGFRRKVQENLPRARQVVRVLAQDETLDDGHAVPAHGRETLIEATFEVLPDGVRSAFIAAQKIWIQGKINRARPAVAGYAASAGAAGAVPIPFSDAAILVPIQVGMLVNVTHIFGIQASKKYITSLFSSILGTTATTLGGRALAANLLKLLPGVGTLVGGSVAALTATSLTAALGEAYIAVLVRLLSQGKENPSGDEVAAALKSELGRRR